MIISHPNGKHRIRKENEFIHTERGIMWQLWQKVHDERPINNVHFQSMIQNMNTICIVRVISTYSRLDLSKFIFPLQYDNTIRGFLNTSR